MKYGSKTARFLAAATTAVVAGALVSCSAGSEIDPDEGIEGTTIRVTLANHVWTETIKEMIPEFEEETGAKVEISQLAEDQLSDQYNVKLNAGTDEIDVLMYRPLQENKLFASNGYLSDLTELVENDEEFDWDDFQDGPAALTTYEDEVVGVPIITERTVLYYRKDLLEQAGLEVPTTLEELEAAAATIHEQNPDVAGYIGRTGKSAAVTQFSAFLFSSGGDFIGEDGTSVIGSDEAREAYTYYGDLIRNHTDATINPEMSWAEAFAVFQQGKAAFIADADSLYKNMIDPEQSTVSDQVGFAAFPAGADGAKPYNVAAWALAVNETSENQSAAWAFIKWATSKAQTIEMTKLGVTGARTSAWEDDAAIADFPTELVEAIKVNGENGVGKDRPLVIDVAKAREIVGDPIVVAIAGGDVDAAIDEANAAFDEFLLEDSE
ncbi:ABC transporter substrate-binding protein [Microbacterium aerolatum]|uniref:Sugar ABC transporter substrate-binding protein n=1 Tax=Microbacterium aerolatum TaxID=153731 RepID=A0A511AIH8_9MICO|nr:sugar ABC transporter substrate-binding protein [Microbacterium aerolatum]MCK3769855.1 sugar ABC transporter substrate-binding protein [Microbacterium aerolatum]GEK87133.1 sugar ABC transporter substrate-binding protein [Microbacterium aerolatum]GGB36244.1 sugar ABC transporter substrate-binding protein [Microbacterium aerolatum]